MSIGPIEFLREEPPTSPAEESFREARKLWPFVEHGTRRYIANVQTDYRLLRVGCHLLPVSINDGDWENSYVTSPFTHYVTYAVHELYLVQAKLLRAPFRAILLSLGAFLRWGRINRVVHVNNFLLSTNLYPHPALTAEEVAGIRALLAREFPGHAWVFRSLPENTAAELRSALAANGFAALGSRQVYFQDPASPAVKRAKPLKQDSGLFRRSGYEWQGPDFLTDAELPRVLELYELLYIEKYSHLNPRFTLDYLRWARDTGFLSIHTLRKEGRIDGVLGFYRRGGHMTTPLFGYDTRLPPAEGLYRILSLFLIEEAARQKLVLNASSGAPDFKRMRGGRAEIEFSHVASSHLPVRQRLAWTLLRGIVNHVMVPLMRRWRL